MKKFGTKQILDLGGAKELTNVITVERIPEILTFLGARKHNLNQISSPDKSYFTEKYDKLCKLLQTGLELNAPVYVSY